VWQGLMTCVQTPAHGEEKRPNQGKGQLDCAGQTEMEGGTSKDGRNAPFDFRDSEIDKRDRQSNLFWFPTCKEVSYVGVASVRYIKGGGRNVHAVLDCG